MGRSQERPTTKRCGFYRHSGEPSFINRVRPSALVGSDAVMTNPNMAIDGIARRDNPLWLSFVGASGQARRPVPTIHPSTRLVFASFVITTCAGMTAVVNSARGRLFQQPLGGQSIVNCSFKYSLDTIRDLVRLWDPVNGEKRNGYTPRSTEKAGRTRRDGRKRRGEEVEKGA